MTHAVGHKTRRGDRSVEIAFVDPSVFAGLPVLLVDDIVSSGGTLATCAKALVASGATTIDAIVTHALFPPNLIGEFLRAGIRSIRSTNSVPHPTQCYCARQNSRRSIAQGNHRSWTAMSVTVRFCGASRTVTGSCYLFETKAGRLLVDCGLFQGSEDTESVELWRLSVSPGRYRCCVADARAYRP